MKLNMNGTLVKNVHTSANGWVISTPVIPKTRGKIKISGKKCIPCLQDDKNVACQGLPTH